MEAEPAVATPPPTSPTEEGESRHPDDEAPGPESGPPFSGASPFEDRLLDFLGELPVQQLLIQEGTSLPFAVRSGDVTLERQAFVDRLLQTLTGNVVLRSPSLPEPERTPDDDPFGPLSPQEFLGLRARLFEMIKAAAESDYPACLAVGYQKRPFRLRNGDLLRRLPEGIGPLFDHDSVPPLLMDWIKDNIDFNLYVTFEDGLPSPESLPPGTADIMRLRGILSGRNSTLVPTSLADAVFLDRDHRLKPITDPLELRPGQMVVLIVDGNAAPVLVDQSLEPTINPISWLVRALKFGTDSLRPPNSRDVSRRTLPFGRLVESSPGKPTVVTSVVQSQEVSRAAREAILSVPSLSIPSLRNLSVRKSEPGSLVLSFRYVDPYLRNKKSPPTYTYDLKASPSCDPPFRLYGLVTNEEDAQEE